MKVYLRVIAKIGVTAVLFFVMLSAAWNRINKVASVHGR